MKIAVFGTGYVGLVSGVGFAEMGNDVTCVDVDARKIQQLSRGIPTIHEPGLAELLNQNIGAQRLVFTTDAATALRDVEVVFIAVGTPSLSSGAADISAVEAVARSIGSILDHSATVVVKSTVSVGTAEHIESIIRGALALRGLSGNTVDVVANPEFLREGAAVRDFLNPDRVIVGVATARAQSVMERLYHPVARAGRPVVFMDRRSAELAKYAANAFLATKVSFINEIAAICEAVGADVHSVAKAMGMDSRIGPRFLHAGIGWGGSCFPKDVAALASIATSVGVPAHLVAAAVRVNEEQRERSFQKVCGVLGGVLRGRVVAIWGLAFKPRTDDVRDAPALALISALLEVGAVVRAFDPIARANAVLAIGHQPNLTFVERMYDAVAGADALCVCTEWDEFRSPDFARVHAAMRTPAIVDGRNIYDPDEMAALGFVYHCIGRPAAPYANSKIEILNSKQIQNSEAYI